VQQAFNVPYHVPQALAEERYVSAVYVFNTGDITANARTQIYHGLPANMRANVRFFSGATLEILANSQQRNELANLRQKLTALNNQLKYNIEIWQDTAASINPDNTLKHVEIRPPMLHGIEDFLSQPLFTNPVANDKMFGFWQWAHMIRTVSMKHYMSGFTFVGPVAEMEIATMKTMCGDCIAMANSSAMPLNNR